MSELPMNGKKPAGRPAFFKNVATLTTEKVTPPHHNHAPCMAQAMRRPESHHSLVLRTLLAGDKLTHGDALRLFSCSRLAAVIYDLRREGWSIQSSKIDVYTARGTVARVAEYSLMPAPRTANGSKTTGKVTHGY